MNVLVVGNFGNSWDGSVCDERNIAESIELLGYKARTIQRETIEALKLKESDKFDFILIAQWNNYLDNLFEKLRPHTDGPIVYWAFDYQAHEPQEWHEKLIEGADIFLGKEISNYKKYSNFQWLPADFAPNWMEPVRKEVEQDIDVLFTGTNLPWCKERQDILKAVDEKYNLHVYSMTPNDWKEMGLKNVHGPAVDKDLTELVARAKINLSVDLYHEPGFWSDRNAQIMCCGGFTLFRYVPMSELVFRCNVGYFYSIQDCLDQIEYYLGEGKKERRYIATRGLVYAQENLKAIHRTLDLLTLVKEYKK